MGDYGLTSLPISSPWVMGGLAFLSITLLLLAWGPAWLPFGFLKRIFRGRAHVEAERALNLLRVELEGLRQKFGILGAYSTEYFNTFQAAGWNELRVLLDDLQDTENALNFLMESRRYQDVQEISHYLLGSLPQEFIKDLLGRYEGLSHLSAWRNDARMILLKIITASMASARQTAELGISRKLDRKPTLVTLAELQTALRGSQLD